MSPCPGQWAHYADEAAARLAVAEARAAGRIAAYARRCQHCGRWKMATRGVQGVRKPQYALWWRVYKYRIAHGLERCRICGRTDRLTFDHITPYAVDRTWRFDNNTILCVPHNVAKGATLGSTLRSLAEEEAEAPPDQRWSVIAREVYPDLPSRGSGGRGARGRYRERRREEHESGGAA